MPSVTWFNTVAQIEIPEALHDAFFDGLLHDFGEIATVSSTQINEVLRSIQITMNEPVMEEDNIWRLIATVAETLALDGLDMIACRFHTERCWSRE